MIISRNLFFLSGQRDVRDFPWWYLFRRQVARRTRPRRVSSSKKLVRTADVIRAVTFTSERARVLLSRRRHLFFFETRAIERFDSNRLLVVVACMLRVCHDLTGR